MSAACAVGELSPCDGEPGGGGMDVERGGSDVWEGSVWAEGFAGDSTWGEEELRGGNGEAA